MFSIATAPAKQSATEAIGILGGRLASGTLLEDRRAAILGLRSFAKDYPATVASAALRDLISSLSKDGEDADTVKVVLETLLMLFNPSADSPEASEEIMLWMADEFTQRQENVTLLLEFLESSEFYSRLYALQLLNAILVARTERTEECVFIAPLGISRLVLVLDDERDAIRNEALSLLIGLTPTSIDIQKLVAFESAFDKIFYIVDAEGSLNEGGRTVEDCLILLANLLRRNPSNQALFRESGGIKRLGLLLQSLATIQSAETALSPWAETQRNRNTYAFLAIIRLLLQARSSGVLQNQTLLWKHGLCHEILQLAFNDTLQIEIKAEALMTCGDMVRDAPSLQETFAQLSVNSTQRHPSSGTDQKHDDSRVYVIDGLLELTLNLQDSSSFDLRFAASECLKSYFSNHLDVRLHFLSRAIEGYLAGGNESANILNVLLRPSTDLGVADPYRQWFAAVIAFHLIFENPEGKAKALAIAEGDAANGEEVVTSLQTIAAHFITGINRGDDQRILVGYAMLLTGWLFEDLDAVNDFLSEGSNVQSLIQAVSQPTIVCGEIVQGLCAMLLGIVYEFSTKDSTISRTSLHSMLMSRLDRERYVDRLVQLRSHPALRDFETTPQKRDPLAANGLAEVYFDSCFVNFFKDNYSRISRALDRSPELEISIITNGVQKGISRELVDSLRSQLKEKEQALENAKVSTVSLEARFNEEQIEHRRSREEAAKELAKATQMSDDKLKAQELELIAFKDNQAVKDAEFERRVAAIQVAVTAKEADYQKELDNMRKSTQAEINQIQRRAAADAEQAQKRFTADMEQYKRRSEQESEQKQKQLTTESQQAQGRAAAHAADLKATISRLEVDLAKLSKEKEQDLRAKSQELLAKDTAMEELRTQHITSQTELKNSLETASQKIVDLENQLKTAKSEESISKKKLAQAEASVTESEKSKEAIQSELDDLLIVFGDLEEQVAKQKSRLRELGEPVSDADDTDEDEDDVD